MSSLRRITASRANGSRSRGPVTPEGKARVSQNAVNHGLLARVVVLQDESATVFQELLDHHIQKFQPADVVELGLVEEMVSAAWRLRRTWAIETRMFDMIPAGSLDTTAIDHIAEGFKSLAATPALPLMHRYETRLHMMYQRAFHNLMLLRAGIPNKPNPISEQSPDPPLCLPAPAELS